MAALAASSMACSPASPDAKTPPPKPPPSMAPDAPSCDDHGDDRPFEPAITDHVALACVRGAGDVDDKRLEAALATVPGPYDSEKIAKDLRMIYASGAAQDARATATRTAAGVVVKFIVMPRPIVKSVTVRGAHAIPEDDIAHLAGVRAGLPFDPQKTRAGAALIAERYNDLGYAYAKASYEAAPDGEQVTAVITVEEGPLVHVRSIALPGASKAVEAGAKKAFVLQPGAAFTQAALERDALVASAACYDHGFLESKVDTPVVTPSPDRAVVDITMTVHEGASYRLKSITFAGDVDDEAAYRAMLGIKPGATFSREILVTALDKMRERRRIFGKPAELVPETELDPKAHTVKLVIRFAAKP